MITCHSEYGKLKSLWIKPADAAFRNQEILSKEWKALNYLAEPDYSSALEEYKQFKSLLQIEGLSISEFSETTGVNMDSIYCRDASIATNFGMILCNMGKGARSQEPAAQLEAYERTGQRILGRIEAPGTLEGGDVAWLDEKMLAVGHTYRTNLEGITQLKGLLEPKGIEVLVAELPHYKGPSDVFHLMSILSPVDKDLAVVYSPLMPVAFRNQLLERGMELVEVPDEEFESMGCNVLALEARKCLMVSGNPKTEARLRLAGCQVLTYPGEEISLKGGGGPTCLTRPVQREIG